MHTIGWRVNRRNWYVEFRKLSPTEEIPRKDSLLTLPAFKIGKKKEGKNLPKKGKKKGLEMRKKKEENRKRAYLFCAR